MSYYAQFENGTGGDVATIAGWGEFLNWVSELEGVENLRHLTEYGWSEDLPQVESELREALENAQPTPDVESTGRGLLKFIRNRGKATNLVVSDGTTSNPGGEENA